MSIEEQITAEQAEVEAEAIEQVEETVQVVEEAIEEIPSPKRSPGTFERWLETQKDREDGTGKVARFVLADMEDECWVRTRYAVTLCNFKDGDLSMFDRYRDNFVKHLQNLHGADDDSTALFVATWNEWIEARREWVMEPPPQSSQPTKPKRLADFS